MLFPYADRIIIEPVIVESGKSKGGVYLPDSVKQDGKLRWGTVVAVGPGRYNDSASERVPLSGMSSGNYPDRVMTIGIGDVVGHHMSAGIAFTDEGKNYLILAEQDVQVVRATEV